MSNSIILGGAIVEEPTFSHNYMGENFYQFKLATLRNSEAVDILPCLIPETYLKKLSDRVLINGEIRSRNVEENGKNRTLIYVFVVDVYEYEKDENYVQLQGNICTSPKYRETPLGRKISDVIVASNRQVGYKSDYIPCIVWGRNAVRVSEMEVGTEVNFFGRLQSREYLKRYEDGTEEIKTAYEFSVHQIKEV